MWSTFLFSPFFFISNVLYLFLSSWKFLVFFYWSLDGSLLILRGECCCVLVRVCVDNDNNDDDIPFSFSSIDSFFDFFFFLKFFIWWKFVCLLLECMIHIRNDKMNRLNECVFFFAVCFMLIVAVKWEWIRHSSGGEMVL